MPRYQVILKLDRCDGIFACLTRDPRFVEGPDGLATIDPGADPVYDNDGDVEHDDERTVATFDDDRIEEAKQAARACPTDAITVREVDDHE